MSNSLLVEPLLTARQAGLRRRGAGRRLALLGLWSLTASVSVGALSSAFDRYDLVAVLVQALAVLAALGFWAGVVLPPQRADRGNGWPRPLAAAGLTISLLWPVVTSAPYPGNTLYWVSAHLIALGAVLAHGHLRQSDVRATLRVLMLVSLLSLAGPRAFSYDVRVVLPLPGRLTGALGHPNVTGPAAGLLLLLTPPRLRWRVVLDLALATLVLLLTLSYTALVALTVAAALLRVRSQQVRRPIVPLGVILMAAPWLLVRFAPGIIGPELFTGRGAIWEWALKVHKESWQGLGIGLFGQLRGSVLPIKWFHAHNQFVMDWITGGWVLALATSAVVLGLGLGARAATDRRALSCWLVLVLTSFTEVPFFLDFPGARVYLVVVLAALCLPGSGVPEPRGGADANPAVLP